jgi:hypothetical protein
MLTIKETQKYKNARRKEMKHFNNFGTRKDCLIVIRNLESKEENNNAF